MRKIKIIVVDDSRDVCETIRGALSAVQEFEIIKVINDPLSVDREVRRLKPDILLLDMVMSPIDGDDILEGLQGSLNFNMGIIAMSPIVNDMTISRYAGLGAHYFIPKPVNTPKLIKKIKLLRECLFGSESEYAEANENSIEETDRSLTSRITKVLLRTGVTPKLKGFCFIRESVCFLCEEGNELTSVTKIVYPKIAADYGTEPEKVERAIRTAIEKAFSGEGGGRFYHETLCPCYTKRASSKAYPSNREFIFTVAEYIRNIEPADLIG